LQPTGRRKKKAGTTGKTVQRSLTDFLFDDEPKTSQREEPRDSAINKPQTGKGGENEAVEEDVEEPSFESEIEKKVYEHVKRHNESNQDMKDYPGCLDKEVEGELEISREQLEEAVKELKKRELVVEENGWLWATTVPPANSIYHPKKWEK